MAVVARELLGLGLWHTGLMLWLCFYAKLGD